MTAKSSPIVSLQAPKDVSLTEIDAELSKIWQSYGVSGDNEETPAATRATTFSLVVYEPEETQQLLSALGFYSGPIDGIPGPRTEVAVRAAQRAYGMAVTGKADAQLLAKLREELDKQNGHGDGASTATAKSYALDARSPAVADAVASRNPCRIIALCPMVGEDKGVTAQVSAYCPVQKHSATTLICCEYITLKGTAAALERVTGIVNNLLIGGLPKFLWWKATPDPNNTLLKRLAGVCNAVIFDSSGFSAPEAELLSMQELVESGMPVADLNWQRIAPWQELTAEAFDPPQRRAVLKEVDRVAIDYHKGNPAQALLFLGWLASRLHWRPTQFAQIGEEYDLKRIHFTTEDQRSVEAELAAIPTAEASEMWGDLVALKLDSTNPTADCCTVLCSETTGCMRMEAGGGAQSCRFQQVTSPAEQKAELLLSQQLQRWGREALYEESLAVTAQMLKLAPGN